MSIVPLSRRRAKLTLPAVILPPVPAVAPMRNAPALESLGVPGVLGALDEAVTERVLVYGSLPPLGSDVDLLVPPPELAAVRAALRAAGFVERQGRFARFGAGVAEMVECAPTTSWRLPRERLAALFAQAHPLLPGMRHLVAPAPHHALLIRARKAARQRTLTPHLRAGVRAAEDADAQVWERAREDAPAWHARAALDLLQARCRDEQAISRALRWRAYVEQHTPAAAIARARRLVRARFARWGCPQVVAFSGLDGAGKTLQAAQLQAALAAAGQPSCVVWKGVGRNRLLGWVQRMARRLLRPLPNGARFVQALDEICPAMSGLTDQPITPPCLRASRSRGLGFKLAMYGWASLITLTNILAIYRASLRVWGRRRLLIYDRYKLDSIAKLLYWYGDSPATRLLTGLVARATPTPLVAYLLDLPPEVAFQRKGEWGIDDLRTRGALYAAEYARLGVRRLDATAPAADLSAHIAAEVWSMLG